MPACNWSRHGNWTLRKQIGYSTEAGMRVPEVPAYSDDSLLVEEASFSPATGNAVELYAVTGLRHAKDVSAIDNLSQVSSKYVVGKKLVADVTRCPTLGATSRETQTNPLLDNFEGMAVTFGHRQGRVGVSVISDDNFSATQTTRVLNLVARLPGNDRR